jgi:RNA polymerase sigma-B factor
VLLLVPARVGGGHPPRQVFRLRFNENLTQREIAERMGLTQVSVSRLLKRCLPQLTEVTGR